MKTTPSFSRSLMSWSNSINLLLLFLFLTVTFAGLALIATKQYFLFYPLYPQLTESLVIIIVAVSSVMAFMLAIQCGRVAFNKQRKLLIQIQQQNSITQDSIMMLQENINHLAQGDLTIKPTVTDDMTGAIADSVNHVIAALREQIENISTTTLQITAATQEARATAMYLTDASDHQSQQIADVATHISTMTHSIERISHGVELSSMTAKQSVMLAFQGKTAVNRVISDINTIHQHIETAFKHLKRIAATLAPIDNDDMQRLTDDSTPSSQQVMIMLNTIQHDIRDAIASMDNGVSAITNTMALSQNTGPVIEQLEVLNQQLTEQVNHIYDMTKNQADTIAHASENLGIIQDITEQTLTGVNETEATIGRVMNLTNTLRQFVSAFTLTR